MSEHAEAGQVGARTTPSGTPYDVGPTRSRRRPRRRPQPTHSAQPLNEQLRPSRRERRRRQLAVLGVSGLVVLSLGAVTAMAGYRGMQVRDDLLTARELTVQAEEQLRNFELAAARETTIDLQYVAGRADDRAQSPALKAFGLLPIIGDDVGAVQEAAATVDGIAELVVPPLLDAAQAASPEVLAPRDGKIDLAPMQRAGVRLDNATVSMDDMFRRLDAIDADGLAAPIADGVTQLRDAVASTRETTGVAADVAAIVPGLLGQDAPQDILVLFQNNAELRTRGGIPGAAAVLRAEGGQITIVDQVSTKDFGPYDTPVADMPDSIAVHTDRVARYIQNVNLLPDFPTSADLALRMYERSRPGTPRPSAVIAVDPVALSYLLRATGPVQVPGAAELGFPAGGTLSADNATQTLLYDAYANIGDAGVVDAYFASAAAAAFSKLLQNPSGPGAADALERAIGERRLYVWSSNPDHQQRLTQYAVAGAFSAAQNTSGEIGVFLNSATASKLSYFVQQEISVEPWCVDPTLGASPDITRVSVRLTSDVPPDVSTLPRYVLGNDRELTTPGVQEVLVLFYGRPDGAIEGVRLNGEPVPTTAGMELGLPVQVATVQLAPGESREITAYFTKVAAGGADVIYTPIAQQTRFEQRNGC